MKPNLEKTIASTVFIVIFLLIAGNVLGCGRGTAGARARQTAMIQKIAVDGAGNAYLQYCEIVRKPACVAADKAADPPQTKDQRIECLKPCDSDTAQKIKDSVEIVRAAQTVMYELVKAGGTPEDLQEARARLRSAAGQLILMLEDLGVMDLLGQE